MHFHLEKVQSIIYVFPAFGRAVRLDKAQSIFPHPPLSVLFE